MSAEIRFPDTCRAALYIRLSKEDDHDGPSESVTNQRALLEQYAAEHHLHVYDTYIDDGWSGCNFDRPAFSRMLSDIEHGKVNLVITKDLSRLGRDYILTGHYLERYFPEWQVRYISLLDGIDTGIDSSANDITPFRAIMNDWYARDISKKIKSVKQDKQRRGLFIGGKPVFGYKMHPYEKNKTVIDEQAAAVVRRIFSMALSGVSCRQIAQQLNQEHIAPPSVYAGQVPSKTGVYSGLWSSERISEMLKNETYIGNMVQGRTVKISYKSKKSLRKKPEDWMVVEHTHAPIIDRATFNTVQQLLASRRHTRSRTYNFPLKGLIFCHECGHPLGVVNRKNAAGEDVLYFICRTYLRFTKNSACTSHCIKEQIVTNSVINILHQIYAPYLTTKHLLPAAQKAVNASLHTQQYSSQSNLLSAQLRQINAQIDQIYLDRLNGVLQSNDFERIYQQLCQTRTQIQTQLNQNTRPEQNPTLYAHELTEKFLKNCCQNRLLLTQLIERIELTAEKSLLIRFRSASPDG